LHHKLKAMLPDRVLEQVERQLHQRRADPQHPLSAKVTAAHVRVPLRRRQLPGRGKPGELLAPRDAAIRAATSP
jgi:hypothetical protein